ncbi:MAG TPA: methyltransferase domain-containing protein [Candidatus Binatia bacterium]|nr:methyltransferase domain-containing protein [Candidatus Binatia bacterium]
MQRLVDAHELLDGDLGDAATLEGNLRDLRRINRRFGGVGLTRTALRRLWSSSSAGSEALDLLDVGTGAGDIPLALLRDGGPWERLRVTAVDSRPEVLAAAVRLAPELASLPEISLVAADGRRLPWPDGAFDVAHASLVLHHLSSRDAVALLAELGRVSRVGIVVNDLSRSRLGWLGAVVLLRLMTRNRWTLHDGPLSVRRAWTIPEVRALMAEAGLQPVATVLGVAGHRWAIAAVRA